MDRLSVLSLDLSRWELRQACTIAATAGFLSHILYYIHGYKIPQTVPIFFFNMGLSTLVYGISIYQLGVVQGIGYGVALSTSYLGALFLSMSIYRLWFHPLSRFPGPFWAKITKMHNMYQAQDGHLHDRQLEWLRQYGNIVRVGPGELLLGSVDNISQVHSGTSKCSKRGTFYDYIAYNGEYNLDAILDREPHRWRRQIWDKGMGTKAQKQYESNARGVVHDWLDQIVKHSGSPVDMQLFCLLIPFEAMGHMGYSKAFKAVKEGKENHMLHLLEVTFKSIGLLGSLLWPIDIATRFKLGKEQIEFDKLAVEVADERIAQEDDGQDRLDLMKFFLEDYRAQQPKSYFNKDILYADSTIVMTGGTDTIAAALTHVFYYLAKDQSLQQQVRDEISPYFGKQIPNEFSDENLRDLPILNSVIDETLRMHPPTLNNGCRNVPPEGIVVEGQHIPGGTVLWPGLQACHRNPRYFKEVDEFIPERWTTKPELVIDRRAFHPFASGPMNCVGQRPALTLIRLTIAYTTYHYDFQFAPHENGTRIFTECFNQLILRAGPLDCTFTKREQT